MKHLNCYKLQFCIDRKNIYILIQLKCYSGYLHIIIIESCLHTALYTRCNPDHTKAPRKRLHSMHTTPWIHTHTHTVIDVRAKGPNFAQLLWFCVCKKEGRV